MTHTELSLAASEQQRRADTSIGALLLEAGKLSPDNAERVLRMQKDLGIRYGEAARRLGRNHPQYQSPRAEVDKISAMLGSQVRSASNSVGGTAQILQQHEAAVRASLAAQKARVLQVNRARDELGVLVKDVESAQRAFDSASQRFAQTKIEGQSEQSDIAVLNPATPPLRAAAPRVLLNSVLSLFLGSLLGLGFALLAEMIDRRVRSAGDLAELLQLPVLGEIDWHGARRPRSLAALLPRRLRLT